MAPFGRYTTREGRRRDNHRLRLSRVYIRRIRQGLRDKKAWAIGLLQYWDRILFPTADKSREHDAAGNEELDDDDEELDDIFGQAPSAAERTNIPQVRIL
jgi:hypothetical protein